MFICKLIGQPCILSNKEPVEQQLNIEKFVYLYLPRKPNILELADKLFSRINVSEENQTLFCIGKETHVISSFSDNTCLALFLQYLRHSSTYHNMTNTQCSQHLQPQYNVQ